MRENIISVVVNISTNPHCYGRHTERLLMFCIHFHSTASICICLISSSSNMRCLFVQQYTNKLRSNLSGRDYLSLHSSHPNFENTASSYASIPIRVAHCFDSKDSSAVCLCMPMQNISLTQQLMKNLFSLLWCADAE